MKVNKILLITIALFVCQWIEVSTTLAKINTDIFQESVNAVNNKYDPQSDGYEFLKIVSVDT